MIRFTTRAIRYLGAFLNGKLDEVMDPRVQIEQAIAEAQRQHGMLSDQAGAVIGHQRELEIKIARAGTEASRLRECAGQALLLAERSRASGDAARAANHEATATRGTHRQPQVAERSTKRKGGSKQKQDLNTPGSSP